RVAHASRVLARASRFRELSLALAVANVGRFQGKNVLAGRQNQHARCVRYPIHFAAKPRRESRLSKRTAGRKYEWKIEPCAGDYLSVFFFSSQDRHQPLRKSAQ